MRRYTLALTQHCVSRANGQPSFGWQIPASRTIPRWLWMHAAVGALPARLLLLLDAKPAPDDFCCHFPSARMKGARGSGRTGNRPTVLTSPWALIVQSAGAKMSRAAALQEVPGRDRP